MRRRRGRSGVMAGALISCRDMGFKLALGGLSRDSAAPIGSEAVLGNASTMLLPLGVSAAASKGRF